MKILNLHSLVMYLTYSKFSFFYVSSFLSFLFSFSWWFNSSFFFLFFFFLFSFSLYYHFIFFLFLASLLSFYLLWIVQSYPMLYSINSFKLHLLQRLFIFFKCFFVVFKRTGNNFSRAHIELLLNISKD